MRPRAGLDVGLEPPRWQALRWQLMDPACDGLASIDLLAHEPFYDPDALPFALAGGGTVLRVVPHRGFPKEALAGSADERRLIVDCPDAPGWLAPEGLVAAWLARNVSCPRLDDLVLSHALYEYLIRPDEDGFPRGGARGGLVRWVPGMPEMAMVSGPEWLPDDREAPAVNRDRARHADAVLDLVSRLEEAFDVESLELGLRFRGRNARPQAPDPAGDEDAPDEAADGRRVWGGNGS